ncbi:MAG: hypothetical protein WC607_03880 [Candidatus Micrarchaeia archaeon]
MGANKTAFGAMLFGFAILAAAWFVGYSSLAPQAAVTEMLLTALAGSIITFGLFLVVAGVLVLIV